MHQLIASWVYANVWILGLIPTTTLLPIEHLSRYEHFNYNPILATYRILNRINDEGSVPEMRIWSILLFKSDLK